MGLRSLDGPCPEPPESEDSATAHLTLVPDAAESDREITLLRMIGVVRARSGEPLVEACLAWWHPVSGDVLPGDGDDAQGSCTDAAAATRSAPDGVAVTGEGGDFDVVAADPDEHVHVVVSAPGYESISVRLVPLPGLPPITPPITRSGRAPLAVRRGAGAVECWCEFALTPRSAG